MDSPIILKVIEQMNSLPPNLQEQVLEFVIALRGTHSQHFAPNTQNSASDAWDVIESLIGTVEAPPDWASEHDHYLYGTPKRGETTPSETEQIDRVTFAMHVRQELEAIELDIDHPAAFDVFAADAKFYKPESNIDNRDRLHRILDGSEEIGESDVQSVLYALKQHWRRRRSNRASEFIRVRRFMKQLMKNSQHYSAPSIEGDK